MNAKRVLLSLIVFAATTSLVTAQYIPSLLDWIYFPHTSFSFEETYRPYTGSIGGLEFVVADSSGDYFINPAKVYDNYDSRISVLPSIYFYNLEPYMETEDGKEISGTRERLADFPLTVLINQKKFFFAASASFTDYKRRYYSFSENETYSGPDIFGLFGIRLNEASSIAVSYRTELYTTEYENTIPAESKSNSHQFKAGLNTYREYSRWSFLGSYYQTNFERRENQKFNGSGFLLQTEYHRLLSEYTTVATRLTYDRRMNSYNSESPQSDEDVTSNRYGIGAGITSFVNNIRFAMELELEYLNTDMTSSQESFQSRLQAWQRNFNFRAGIDAPLSKHIHWTSGVSFSRLSVDLHFNSSGYYTYSEPEFEENQNKITSGLEYRNGSMILRYQFSYGNEPYVNYNTFTTHSPNIFFNRIIFEYKF